jgi:hypothetical protein
MLRNGGRFTAEWVAGMERNTHLEGFARHEFVMKGRNTQSYGGKDWTKSGHNLDFIFGRDDIAYGVEVKNTLGYMEQEELRTKMKCVLG